MSDTNLGSAKRPRVLGNWGKVLKQHAPILHAEWRAVSDATFKKSKLTPKLKHLVWLAVDSVSTHLYGPGAVLHAEEALENGATVGELMDTLRLACLPSNRGLEMGFEFLSAELNGGPSKSWPELATELSPEFKRAYDKFIDGESPGGLDARSRCLVALAVFSNPAVADREGTRQTIRQAVELGIERDVIIEVMELGAMLRAHAFSNILDEIADAIARHSKKAT